MSLIHHFPPIGMLSAALALSFTLAGRPAAATAQERTATADNRLTLAWEYDNNVLEEGSGKIAGASGAASLFSKIRIKTPDSQTLLNYQLGYKGHYNPGETSDITAGDILVNRVSFDSERRLSGGWSAGSGAELKTRNIYRKNQLNLLSEEGYLRGMGKLFARTGLGDLGRLTLGYRYSFYNFKTFHTFDYGAHTPNIQLTRALAGGLIGSLGYSYTHRKYQRLINRPDSRGVLVQLDQTQRDRLHQLDFTAALSRTFLLDFTYSLQRNDSNNFGFSYWNNRFSILFADKLPREFFLNAYLFFELRRYSDKVSEPILVDIITEDNDNNGLVLKLSRPLNPKLEAAATLSAFRNQSSIRDLNFNKGLFNFSLTCRF